MNYEKSCGAAVFRQGINGREYLVVLNKKAGEKSHWGFPKGHCENTENEYETAAREIFEETGLRVIFHGSSRAVSTYSPKAGIKKDAVYFLATVRNGSSIFLQDSEIAEYRWLPSDKAKALLTYDADILAKLEHGE